MTVAEQYGRIFPHPQFEAGTTAHRSGEYAKTLKKGIPCIVSEKSTLASLIIRAFRCGCVPARHLGCSPAVLAVARALGTEIDFARIRPEAMEELQSVGCTGEWMHQRLNLSVEEVIARADQLIPGVEQATLHRTEELVAAGEADTGAV